MSRPARSQSAPRRSARTSGPGLNQPPPRPGGRGLAEGAGPVRKRNRPRWAYLAQTGMRCVMARRATTVFMALAAADTVLAGMGCDRPRWLTKPLLMPALMAGTDRSSRRALAFGPAGGVAPRGAGGAAGSPPL